MKNLRPKPFIIFIIFFAIVITIFFHRFIFFKEVFIPAHQLKLCYPWRAEGEIQKIYPRGNLDGIFIIYPFHLYINRSIKERIIPKWNPYTYCGSPLLANPAVAVFAPLNILDFFLAPIYSFISKSLLIFFLSCLFMAILVWKLTKNSLAGLLSGLIYVFNGLWIYWLIDPPTLGVMMWLPLLFLFLIKDVERHSYLYGIAVGLILAIQILNGAGRGNLSFYSILAALIFSLYLSIIKKREYGSFTFLESPLFTVIFATGLGALLSAVQLLPTIELVRHCHRTASSSLMPFYIFPATLIISLFPNFFGNIMQNSWWGHYLYRYLFNCRILSTYMLAYAGVLPVFLALLVIGRKSYTKYYLFFGWLAVTAFLFSHFYPLLDPIQRFIPILNKLHGHLDALWIYIFSLSITAGLGLSSLVQGDICTFRLRRLKKGLVIILITSIILIAVISAIIGSAEKKLIAIGEDYIRKHYAEISRPSGEYHYPLTYYTQLMKDILLNRVKTSFSLKNLSYWRSIIFIFATLGIFILYSKESNRSKLGYLCVAVLLLDLFSYGIDRTPYVNPDSVYPPTPAIEFLQEKSQENYSRIVGLWQEKFFKDNYDFYQNKFTLEIVPPASSLVFKLYDARGYASLYLKNYSDFYKTFYPDKEPGDSIQFPDFNQRMFDLLSVKYILTAPGYKLTQDTLDIIYDDEIRIYKNRNALPRIFLAPYIKNVEDSAQTLKILSSPDFNPHQLVLARGYTGRTVFNGDDIINSTVSIVDLKDNKVAIKASMENDGALVLTDTHFPGWKAFVDGKETKIYRANYIHRMVMVPEGVHQVEFVYDPLSFRIGLIITIITVMGCLIGYFISCISKLRYKKA